MDETRITQLFDAIAPNYDRINRILSWGLDLYWRKVLIHAIPPKADSLLDIACGSGDVLIQAMKKQCFSKAIGLDPSSQMLKRASHKSGLLPCEWVEGSAFNLPFENESFDAITLAFGIRNMDPPQKALAEILRVLKTDGTLLILEFSLPQNPLLKKLHLFYLRKILPKIGAFISKHPTAYTYLNTSIESFPYGPSFLSLMNSSKSSYTPLTGGIVTLYQIQKC